MSRKSSINKIKRNNSSSKNIEASLVMDLYLKGHSPITSHYSGNYNGLMECDVLSVSKADYIYEYEVKISKGDFKKDFLKDKHKRILEKNFIYEEKGEKYHIVSNYFYFVVPENLVSVDEIPEYSGLMYYVEGKDKQGRDISYFNVIKKAPILHKVKASNKFIRSLSHQLTCKLVFNKIN